MTILPPLGGLGGGGRGVEAERTLSQPAAFRGSRGEGLLYGYKLFTGEG